MINFQDFIIVLAISVVIVSLMRRLHMSPLLGYLIAGAVVGPFGLQYLESKEEIRYIAEFGVVFLLFTIGLELSFPKLISMRRALLGLGGLQVILCTVVVIAIAYYANLSWPAIIAVAGALALSSTAVVTKQLIEQDELHQSHGKLSLSVLLFQDLAAVPFLIIVPALADSSVTDHLSPDTYKRIGMGALTFIVMLGMGRWLLRPLFHHIAEARSSELFMLTALLVVLGSAFLTEEIGLSPALGAFLAGVMLAETEYAHQIESDIQPFRDILLGLFFISVGLMINPEVIYSSWEYILMILVGIIAFKALVVTVLAKIVGASLVSSLRAGLVLAQGGEFGLVLLAMASDLKIINPHANQIVLSSVILSMAIAPILIRKSEKIALVISKIFKQESDEKYFPAKKIADTPQNHVIISGYGRVGQTLAKFLEYEGIQYVGLDLDPIRLREANAAKEPVFFGDGADESVLKAAGIKNARMLITAFNNPKQAQRILRVARRLNKEIPILVRTEDDSELEALQIAGATEVIPDKLESSLMLASHMLILLGESPEKAQQHIYEVKSNRYKILSSYFQGQHTGTLESTREKNCLHAVELTEGAYAIGRTIEEISSDKFPLDVCSFSRQGFKCDIPSPHTILKAGDVLVIKGKLEDLYIAEEKLLQG